VRIIAGKHKGRKINIQVDKNLRPTRPMVREAIFSILGSGEFICDNGSLAIEGAVVLDLFSGSGSFAMEALSRGASKVILIDNNRDHINLAKYNLESIGEISNSLLICCDIEKLCAPKEQVDVVFIDPPYRKNMISTAVNKLFKEKWLKDQAIIVIETDLKDQFNLPENFALISQREYGATKLHIFKYKFC